jgi:hypothetical protein
MNPETGRNAIEAEGGVEEFLTEIMTHRWAWLEGCWKTINKLIAEPKRVSVQQATLNWNRVADWLIFNGHLERFARLTQNADEEPTKRAAANFFLKIVEAATSTQHQ